MQNSRLVEIFQNLNKKELRELEKFVQSPFHNQREDVISLYNYLLKFIKSKENISLKKELIYPLIFPNEDYSEKKIRYTMSFLYQTIKEFLAYQEFAADKITKQIALVKILRKKGIDRLFDKEISQAEQMLKKQAIKNQHFHFQKYVLAEERYFFNMRNTRGTMLGLQESSDELDQFFIANKLKQSTHALTHQTLGKSNFKPKFFEKILQHVSKNEYPNSPAIAIYQQCIQVLIEENSLPYFQELRRLINETGSCFPQNELHDIFIFALNYCIKKVNEREALFTREAFEIYKQGINQGVFIENGILSRFNYKNIISLGISLEEFSWAEMFIEKYKPYLEKKYRESTYCFNLALLYYKKKNYSEAMILLQKVSSDDVLNNLYSRRMLVRIYYDKNEFDALNSLLDSFQNYIYRKRDIGYQKHLYLNLIKFTRKLLQKESYSNTQIEALKQEIENTKNVAEKIWLLEQLEK